MKGIIKQSVIRWMVLLAAGIMIALMAVPALADEITPLKVYLDANAKKKPVISKTFPYGASSVDDIYDIKCSDPKVVSVKVRQATEKLDGEAAKYYKICVEQKILGPGKATVTFKNKANETLSELTNKFEVYKYVSIIKSLKIGKTEYKKLFEKKVLNKIPKKKINSKKVKLTLKKGYKLKSISFWKNGKEVNLKNGFKKKFKKGDAIRFAAIDKKGVERTFVIEIS